MKHQIILLGRDLTSVYHGIKELKPDYIHLIETDETKDIYKPLLNLLPKNILCKVYHTDPYDCKNIIRICKDIHREFEGVFSYNLSEGTKPMAFAACRVAIEYHAYPFYLTQLGDSVRMDTYEITPLNCILNNKEILALSGNNISQYQDAKELKDEDIRASRKIKNFIENYPDVYTRLRKFFGIYCKSELACLPSSQTLGDDIRFKQKDGTIHVMQQNRTLLRLNQPNATFLLFDGRWWETLVAQQVRNWSRLQPKSPEVWQSVIFQSPGENQMKNEVDVLLNNKQKVIFIECKSGMVGSNDIYKIDAVRQTYGGNISQAVLASYYPIEKNLKEKCHDLQIELFAPPTKSDRKDFIQNLPNWLDTISEEVLL
ncbi:MAG: DUF1887 family CARF protein [Bacteroidales bacterium]|nr:DUF1887 family CARF protein [Bacteroidales bacterium]